MISILLSLFLLFCPFLLAFSLAGTTAYQAVPWNDFYMQGSPFSNQLRSQMPFSSTAGGQYFTEQVSYTQPPCLPSSPYLPQVPNGTTLASAPHTGKQKEVTPPDQSSYQNLQTEPELTSPAKRQEVESSSKKGETGVGNCKARWFFCFYFFERRGIKLSKTAVAPLNARSKLWDEWEWNFFFS